jgi:hypothetical protein
MTVAGWLSRARSIGGSTPVAVALLLAANAIPLLGVLYLGWDVATILILYWLENGVVGLLNVPKILLAAGPSATGTSSFHGAHLLIAAFFVLNYGVFWIGHGVFVLVLTGRAMALGLTEPLRAVLADPSLQLAATALFISHAASLWVNYIGRGEYRTVSPGRQMFEPYPRMVVLHVTIILGGAVIIGAHEPALLVALLVVLKTAIDLALHLRQHSRRQAVTGAVV